MSVGLLLRSLRDLGRFFATEAEFLAKLDEFKNSPLSGIANLDKFLRETPYQYDSTSNCGRMFFNEFFRTILFMEYIFTHFFSFSNFFDFTPKEIAEITFCIENKPTLLQHKIEIDKDKIYFQYIFLDYEYDPGQSMWDKLDEYGKSEFERIYKNLKNYFAPKTFVQGYLCEIDLSLNWSEGNIPQIINNINKALFSNIGVFYCDKNTRYKPVELTCNLNFGQTQPFQAYENINDLNTLKQLVSWTPYMLAIQGNLDNDIRTALDTATGTTLPNNIVNAINKDTTNTIFQKYVRDNKLTINDIPSDLCINVQNVDVEEEVFMSYNPVLPPYDWQYIDNIDYNDQMYPIPLVKRRSSFLDIVMDLATYYNFDPFSEIPDPGTPNLNKTSFFIFLVLGFVIVITISAFVVYYYYVNLPKHEITTLT